MTDFLQALHDDLLAAESNRDRAQQTDAGASQTDGCRSELVMLGNGIPESDPRLGWSAWVGNAIHERLAMQLAGPGRIVEQRFTYRGVPATIDRYDEADEACIDYKSKESAGDIAAVRRDGPPARSVKQVMLGAAALIDAGHPVRTVRLVYVPRTGTLEDSWVWEAPLDRSLADEAAEWHEKLRALVAERSGLDVEQMIDGLRDKPPSWCWQYCTRATACRGERPALPVVDEAVVDVAAEYVEAQALEAEGKARKAKAREFLLGRNGVAGEFRITTSGGNDRTVEVEDVEALHQLWAFVHGDEPVPVRSESTVSAVTLRVSKVKK